MAEKEEKQYFLIGSSSSILKVSRKLPTLREILQNFIYHHCENGKTIKDSTSLVLNSALLMWNKRNIAIKRLDKCQNVLKNAYNEWQNFLKNKNSQSDLQKTQRALFIEELDKEFNVRNREEGDIMETSDQESDSQIEMLHQEEEPSTSSGVIPKRSSSLKANEKLKNITAKRRHNDDNVHTSEEGKTL